MRSEQTRKTKRARRKQKRSRSWEQSHLKSKRCRREARSRSSPSLAEVLKVSQFKVHPSCEKMLRDFPLFKLSHRGDPTTSLQAAARAPCRTHEMMVLDAIRARPGANAYEIAEATGLNHVQVDRRVHTFLKQKIVERRGQRNGASCLWPKDPEGDHHVDR